MLIIVEKKLHCMGAAGRGDRALGKEGEWGEIQQASKTNIDTLSPLNALAKTETYI